MKSFREILLNIVKEKNCYWEEADNLSNCPVKYVELAHAEWFEQVKEKLDWLQCLEAAGVDNWEGYDYAGDMYREKYGDR